MLMECFGGNLINILNFKQETNKETEKRVPNFVISFSICPLNLFWLVFHSVLN